MTAIDYSGVCCFVSLVIATNTDNIRMIDVAFANEIFYQFSQYTQCLTAERSCQSSIHAASTSFDCVA